MSTDAPTRPSLTADIAPADRGYRGMPGDNAFDRAIAAALTRDRRACADYGRGFTWEASAAQFVEALSPLPGMRRAA